MWRHREKPVIIKSKKATPAVKARSLARSIMINSDLYNFTIVAEELNITSAAARLYITQQTLSEQIKRLEKQYGAQFFVRKPKLRLTPAGERMLTYCRKVLSEEAALLEDLQDLDRSKSYRIGYSGTRGSFILSRAFPIITAEHPGINITLISDTTGNLVSMLSSGRLDAYITSGSSCPPGCKAEVIYITTFVYICRRSLISQYCDIDGFEALPYSEKLAVITRTPFSSVPSHFPFRKTLDEFRARHGLTFNEQFALTSSNLNFSLCKGGQAGIILPVELARRYTSGLDLSEYVRLPLHDMIEIEPLTLITGGSDPAIAPAEFLSILKTCSPKED